MNVPGEIEIGDYQPIEEPRASESTLSYTLLAKKPMGRDPQVPVPGDPSVNGYMKSYGGVTDGGKGSMGAQCAANQLWVGGVPGSIMEKEITDWNEDVYRRPSLYFYFALHDFAETPDVRLVFYLTRTAGSKNCWLQFFYGKKVVHEYKIKRSESRMFTFRPTDIPSGQHHARQMVIRMASDSETPGSSIAFEKAEFRVYGAR